MNAPFPRTFLLIAASWLLTGPAGAAEPAAAPATPTYAVVSLIGDQFGIVTRRSDVGTRLDPNERTNLPVPDAIFDRVAADAVEQALLEAKPGTPVLKASIRDPRLFALQDKLLAESAESHDMRIAVHDLLAKAGATQLILVTKQRGEPSFEVSDGLLGGVGWVSGIGFYIDNDTKLYRVDNKLGEEGFLAPYAYLAISSMEVASMRLVKTRHALETTIAQGVQQGVISHAWDALTPKQKVDALEGVIRRAVTAGMAEMTIE